MSSFTKKKPLAFWIFVGLIVGILLGLVLIPIQIGNTTGIQIANEYIKPFGTIFLNLLKFIVVPIVLCSIAPGRVLRKPAHWPMACSWAYHSQNGDSRNPRFRMGYLFGLGYQRYGLARCY